MPSARGARIRGVAWCPAGWGWRQEAIAWRSGQEALAGLPVAGAPVSPTAPLRRVPGPAATVSPCPGALYGQRRPQGSRRSPGRVPPSCRGAWPGGSGGRAGRPGGAAGAGSRRTQGAGGEPGRSGLPQARTGPRRRRGRTGGPAARWTRVAEPDGWEPRGAEAPGLGGTGPAARPRPSAWRHDRPGRPAPMPRKPGGRVGAQWVDCLVDRAAALGWRMQEGSLATRQTPARRGGHCSQSLLARPILQHTEVRPSLTW